MADHFLLSKEKKERIEPAIQKRMEYEKLRD